VPGDFVFVVGENLAGRSDTAELVPLSGLDRFLAGLAGPPPVLVPGQGLEEHGREAVRGALRRHGLDEALLLDLPAPAPLHPREVHRRRPENVLLAGLEKAGGNLFRASLRICDRQETVLDHTTGSPVAGAVVTEAVRQIALAVGERYLLTPSGRSGRFVLNSLRTTVHRFLLPLPARLEFRLEEVRYEGPDRLRFTGTCDLLQADRVAASGSVDMAVTEEQRAGRTEAHHIREATRVLAERHRPAARPVLVPAAGSRPA
jgi:hypothetical protein